MFVRNVLRIVPEKRVDAFARYIVFEIRECFTIVRSLACVQDQLAPVGKY